MSMEQIETAEGDVRLNAAGLMLLQMLVLLALVVQLTAGRRADGDSSSTEGDIPLVRRYHIETVLCRRDSPPELPDILFTSANEVRWQLLLDGQPLGGPWEIGNKSPEPIETEQAEVRVRYRSSAESIKYDKDGKINADISRTDIGIDLDLRDGQAPRAIDVVFAARSKPIPAGTECQAFWDRLATQLDEQPKLPAHETSRKEFDEFKWSKCSVADLQSSSAVYAIAPNALLIKAPKAHFHTAHSFPVDEAWRKSFFDSLALAGGKPVHARENGQVFTHIPVGKELTEAASPVTFYYRITIRFPESEGTPVPAPTVKFLPTRKVPEAMRFGGNP